MSLPHSLPREEVRRRLRERSGEIADHIPGGIARVETNWPGENLMHLEVHAMGQIVAGNIEIADDHVTVDFDLPPALNIFKPVIQKALEKNGQKLLQNEA